MDPNALAPAAPPEEPRTEYHSPDGYDHTHHHDTYHDHHHGPGEDPYHYQYDEHHHDHHAHDHAGEHGTDHYGVPATTSGAGGGGDTIDPLFDDKPGEGGPIKPFLEHLEDLRWVIIKVAVAILIGMTVCLFAADRIVAMFKWPLERSTQISPDPRQHISLMFGPKEVLNFKLATNNLPGWPITTNRYVELELAPVEFGTNQVLTLRVRKVSEEVPFEKAKPIIYKGIAAPFINSLHIAFFGGLLLAAPFVASEVAAATGFVYVRNASQRLLLRCQHTEYIKNFVWRMGLAHAGVNLQVSGAFGALRTSVAMRLVPRLVVPPRQWNVVRRTPDSRPTTASADCARLSAQRDAAKPLSLLLSP